MESLSVQKEHRRPQLPFSAHKMQVRKELSPYVGLGGVDGGRVCVGGIDDR